MMEDVIGIILIVLVAMVLVMLIAGKRQNG